VTSNSAFRHSSAAGFPANANSTHDIACNTLTYVFAEMGLLPLVLRQPNHIRHFYAAGGGSISPAKLMKATLRERPHRVMLGEMRDPEAASVFVDEVMAGHPGSMSTIHGRNPAEAARRLFNLFKSSPAGQSMQDDTVVAMLASAIDFIIPVENDGGNRSIGEVWFAPEAARRGEGFADLVRTI